MSAVLAYPLGDPAVPHNCGCRFHCYPQIHMSAAAVHGSRTKRGFAEFGTPSDPPKRFLRRKEEYRFYEPGVGVSYSWRLTVIDPATGDETVTSGGPAPLPPTQGPVFVSEQVTPTLSRKITHWTEFPAIVVGVDEYSVTLDHENTTERVIADAIAALPAFPDPFEVTVVPAVRHVVAPGVCFEGRVPWNEFSRFQVPASWQLAANELTFALQRVRYRLELPPMLAGSFTLEWDEVFFPTDEEEAETTLAARSFSGTHADSATGLFDLIEAPENGEVLVDHVRLTALAS